MQLYKSGEEPAYGDIVRGNPNGSTQTVAGFVVGHYDGLLSVSCIKPNSIAEVVRFYGDAPRFELLARNEEGMEGGLQT
jgi:hypothetical protein